MTVMMQERLASVGVRYRSASGGEFVDTTLARVSVAALMAAGPVREFRWYKGRTFYSGWYWSATTGALVAYESRLELARILLADFDAGVCAMVAQPFQLHEPADGRVRQHVPDLLLGQEPPAALSRQSLSTVDARFPDSDSQGRPEPHKITRNLDPELATFTRKRQAHSRRTHTTCLLRRSKLE